jgi:Tol biopolymer transport system component
MAYASDESGKMQVYVQPFPGPGAKIPVSTEGGESPKWSHDGRELFFASEEKVPQLMAVDVQTTPLFRAGQPKALFRIGQGNWDVAPDGKRFLVENAPEASGGSKLEAVTDWFEELKRKR